VCREDLCFPSSLSKSVRPEFILFPSRSPPLRRRPMVTTSVKAQIVSAGLNTLDSIQAHNAGCSAPMDSAPSAALQ